MSYRLELADARVWLGDQPSNSHDAILSDPPYGLEFMGRAWDKVVPPVAVWSETYRVLKPGAYGLIFGGTRTSHRLAVALEDAGFELRDTLMWLYGSGFPKSQDLSKAIDKKAGVEREVTGTTSRCVGPSQKLGYKNTSTFQEAEGNPGNLLTAPATPEAARWQGYGSALKPAYEPILLIRKPPERNNAYNAVKHGCGGLNIDGARIPTDGERPTGSGRRESWRGLEGRSDKQDWNGGNITPDEGRFPANLILDPESAALLDASVGTLKSGSRKAGVRKGIGYGSSAEGDGGPAIEASEGGPSRFFYCAKASRAERNFGSSDTPNSHPTVKPISLSKYLATLLLVPERDTPRQLLNLYTGSGSEMIGALLAGWDEVSGVDLDPEYISIAKARIRYWLDRKKKGEAQPQLEFA